VKKTFKIVSGILLIILLLISLLAASGLLLGRIYKDEIRNYVLSELNSQLEVKMSVKSIDLSVIRKFPFVSLVLNDVAASSGKGLDHSDFKEFSSDTLFYSSRIYLQFNLWDILNEDYRLRKVHAENGKIFILTDNNGNVNYQLIKASGENNFADNFTLKLDGLRVSNFTFYYVNVFKNTSLNGKILDLILKGNFSQTDFSINSQLSLFVSQFTSEGINYASNIKLNSKSIINVNDSLSTINNGFISINDLRFRFGGKFSSGDKTIVDIALSGDKLSIRSLLALAPVNHNVLNDYEPGGKVDILMKVKGEISAVKIPSIRTAFKISDGQIYLYQQNKQISGIYIKGTYSNGKQHNASSSILNFNEFSLDYLNNQLQGSVSVNNFLSPKIFASVSGKIIASDLSDILKIDGLKLKSGILNPDLKIKMALNSFRSINMQDISDGSVSGRIDFNDIAGDIPYCSVPVDLLTGKMILDSGIWYPEFTFRAGKNNFSANVAVQNGWSYFYQATGMPWITGKVYGKYLLVDDFLYESDEEVEDDYSLPDYYKVNIDCNFDSLIYDKFHSADFRSDFICTPELLKVNSLSLSALKGEVKGFGTLSMEGDTLMLLRASGQVKDLDINALFKTFDDFGQDFIISDNLRGAVSGTFEYSGLLTTQLDLITKNLTAQSDFSIQNGELIDFEPITELSRFVELSELQHIKFLTLQNSILIKDEKVYIPQMNINSTAFNLTVSGIHGFDNNFEYKVRLSLDELMAGKAKKAKKQNEEFGIIEDDGRRTNIYLSVSGNPDEYKIRYDKKEAINKIKSDLQEERKVLKTILKEDLGLFKKDSLQKIDSKKNEQFIIDWNEENKTPEIKPDETRKKKAKKTDQDFEISWDEDSIEN
jgi:hypothetical protein